VSGVQLQAAVHGHLTFRAVSPCSDLEYERHAIIRPSAQRQPIRHLYLCRVSGIRVGAGIERQTYCVLHRKPFYGDRHGTTRRLRELAPIQR
jgi:hypothetical protein